MVFLVIGASGQQGGAVARELLAQGAEVRVLARDPKRMADLKKWGAEVVVGDLGNRESIRDALQGVSGAFLVTTWKIGGAEQEVEQALNFIEVADEVGLPHLVYSSVGGADIAPKVPHFVSKMKVEQVLQETSMEWTVLRPVWFMENFSIPFFADMLEQGSLSLPLPAETKISMIAVDDIGRAGAECLLHPEKFSGRTIELAGEEWAMSQIAEAFSNSLGKPIAYQELSDEEALPMFGKDMLEMYHWFQEVGFSFDPRLEDQLGFPLMSFEEYLAAVAAAH